MIDIPLLWNVQGALNPDQISDFGGGSVDQLTAHPFANKFAVDRIIGDIYVSGQHVALPENDCEPDDPIELRLSVQLTNSLGDALVTYAVDQNDGAIGRRRIHERRVLLSQMHIHCQDCSGTQSNNSVTVYSSGMSQFQRTGVPSSKILHYDIRPRAIVHPEQALTLFVEADSPCPAQDVVFIEPKLKMWVRELR